MQINKVLKDISSDLENKMAEINALKDVYKKELQTKFEPVFMELFKTYPKLGGFSWTQYTPYFNDGETCEFNVNEVIVYSVDYDGEVGDIGYYDDEIGLLNIHAYNTPKTKIWGDLPNGKRGYSEEEYDNPEYAEVRAVLDDEGYEIVSNLIKLIESGDNEEFMQSLFGDHTKVIVTREGISTEEYDHD